MGTIQIRKAERVRSKLRLAIAGPSGSGKTMGSLKLAKGIGGRVCMIDTERGSGDLYADLYEYDIISLEPPFKPTLLVEAINAAEAAGYDVIIIDSLSHFWADEGGLLDMADKLESSGKNRFTIWSDITPLHRKLVNTMLNSPKHIIATMRSKTKYEMEVDSQGKSSVKKHGMAPVQRDGMEYEFTIFFDVDQNHHAKASKDRTNMFHDEIFKLDEATGKRVVDWLNSGKTDVRGLKRDVFSQMKDRLEISMPEPAELPEFMRKAVPALTSIEWAEENLEAVLEALTKVSDKQWAQKVAWDGPDDTPSEAPQATQSVETVDDDVDPEDEQKDPAKYTNEELAAISKA